MVYPDTFVETCAWLYQFYLRVTIPGVDPETLPSKESWARGINTARTFFGFTRMYPDQQSALERYVKKLMRPLTK